MDEMKQKARHNEVAVSITFEGTWLKRTSAHPFADERERERIARENDAAQRSFVRELESEGSEFHKHLGRFNERYATPRRVRDFYKAAGPAQRGTWPGGYEVCHMIAMALGADEPRWMNGCWWHDRGCPALGWVRSPADVARIAVPDWPRVPAVRDMLDARRRWQDSHPDEPPSGFGLTLNFNIPGRRAVVQAVNYPAFVDLGIYLVGMTNFLTILGGDRGLTDALMDKCFELSTGYTDFLLSIQPETFEALCGFGGDGTCLFSPGLYERYGAAWDARLFEHVRETRGTPDGLPCNFHSCGPSSHLYEQWGRHPRRENIKTLQTRFLPGQVGRLRAALPETQLELTVHPQHYDFARAAPADVQRVLTQAARAAGSRDVHLFIIATVHRRENLGRLEANVLALEEAMGEIRRTSQEIPAR